MHRRRLFIASLGERRRWRDENEGTRSRANSALILDHNRIDIKYKYNYKTKLQRLLVNFRL